MKNTKIYPGRADINILAEIPDLGDRIIQTTLNEIRITRNDDLLSDLLLESQEAY